MKKSPQNNAGSKPEPGLFAIILLFIGYGLLLVSLLSILNTAFGWELALDVYGSSTQLPKYWDGTIALTVVAVIWTLIAYGINSAPFIRFYRKNKILTILGCIGILVGVFFALDAYDRSIREANAAAFAEMDEEDDTKTETESTPDPEPFNPYEDREVDIIIGNPKLDTMKVYSNGDLFMTINPYEFEDEDLTPGQYEFAFLVAEDTVETRTVNVPAGSDADRSLAYILNPDSAFNLAVLDIQDYYDPDSHNKRTKAKTLNYKLRSLHWHETISVINIAGGSFTLPRSPSLSMSYGTALKLVVLPDQYRDDKDKAFDYAIWKFIEEDKKGYMQDDMGFIMLSPEKKKEAIRNRMQNDVKEFEASLDPS